jgi:CRISPR-associated protein Csh2
VTYYDSASKAGTENELMLWVQLKETSKKVLPNFNALITKKAIDKANEKVVFDFSKVNALLEKYSNDLEKVEIYYQSATTEIKNLSTAVTIFDLN